MMLNPSWAPDTVVGNASSLMDHPAYAYHITNDFGEWPTWNYPTLHDVYCVDFTIRGERNVAMGVFFICEYLFYLALYIPSLIVIGRQPLIEHSCYKLMF